MKIRFFDWIEQRPIREPRARLDDRREPDPESNIRVHGGQAIEADYSVEFEAIARSAHGDMRAKRFVCDRTAVAIAAERIDRPLARRGEIEFVIRRLSRNRDKSFE